MGKKHLEFELFLPCAPNAIFRPYRIERKCLLYTKFRNHVKTVGSMSTYLTTRDENKASLPLLFFPTGWGSSFRARVWGFVFLLEAQEKLRFRSLFPPPKLRYFLLRTRVNAPRVFGTLYEVVQSTFNVVLDANHVLNTFRSTTVRRNYYSADIVLAERQKLELIAWLDISGKKVGCSGILPRCSQRPVRTVPLTIIPGGDASRPRCSCR